MFQRLKQFQALRQIRKTMLYPECLWKVQFDPEQLQCTDRDGDVTSLHWDCLSQIAIATNDLGPLFCDVIWQFYIHPDEPDLGIPMGATGLEQLIEYLIDWPAFNQQEYINAYRSTDNKLFICWRR